MITTACTLAAVLIVAACLLLRRARGPRAEDQISHLGQRSPQT